MLLGWWHGPGAAQIGKRRELQAHALIEGPASPFPRTQDKEPRPGWARLSSLVQRKKIAGFRLERLPARAGKTSKRKLKRTMSESEHRSFRNCRIYRRSRGGWREENPRGRTKRFTGEKAAPPLAGHPEGGGGIVVGNAYDRRAHSFPHYGKLFEEFSTVWKIFQRFRAVGSGLLSGARRAPCEP
jgi:hypothetical protein